MVDSVAMQHRHVRVHDIRYHFAEAGVGPLVVMIHGFPELRYSFRHQLGALASAGYPHVVVFHDSGSGSADAFADMAPEEGGRWKLPRRLRQTACFLSKPIAKRGDLGTFEVFARANQVVRVTRRYGSQLGEREHESTEREFVE